jgi:hypothetical protein
MNELAQAAEDAASLILEIGAVERWVEGAIYPSEMAYFLAVCDVDQIKGIVESGRQDGYSTEIMGHWAKSRDVEIVSIDLEEEEARAAECRARLRGLPLTLVKGNAYASVGRAVNGFAGRRTAILADGPKGWPALSMMAAAADGHVAVVALHNLADWVPEYPWFRQFGGRFHEDDIVAGGPRWQELRQREIAHATRSAAVRSLEASTLGVMRLDNPARAKFSSAWNPAFGLHQPAFVRMLWRLGAYDLTPKLYGASYRLLGR